MVTIILAVRTQDHMLWLPRRAALAEQPDPGTGICGSWPVAALPSAQQLLYAFLGVSPH